MKQRACSVGNDAALVVGEMPISPRHGVVLICPGGIRWLSKCVQAIAHLMIKVSVSAVKVKEPQATTLAHGERP